MTFDPRTSPQPEAQVGDEAEQNVSSPAAATEEGTPGAEAMYQRAQEQAAASGADGAGAASGSGNGASAEEDVVDAEVVDEGK